MGASAPWSEAQDATRTTARPATLAAAALLFSATPATAAPLTLTITNAAPSGTVYAALCTGSLKASACAPLAAAAPSGTTATLTADVAPGDYAVAAYQDLDGDGELDKNWLGRPQEPYALSNAPSGFPSFSKSRITITEAGLTATLTLKRP